MTDKFMSGWGRAEGKINKFIVGTDDWTQAELIKKNAKLRGEMKRVNVTLRKPYYNKRNVLVSYRNFEDMGGSWII